MTESKRAKDELRTSEERYRSLFEAMEEGFALCELLRDDGGTPVDYRVFEANPAFERNTQVPRESVVGRLGSEADPPWTLACSSASYAWSRQGSR